jgi:hypothetical protein
MCEHESFFSFHIINHSGLVFVGVSVQEGSPVYDRGSFGLQNEAGREVVFLVGWLAVLHVALFGTGVRATSGYVLLPLLFFPIWRGHHVS